MPDETTIQKVESHRRSLLVQAASLSRSLSGNDLPFWLSARTARINLDEKLKHAARLENLLIRWRSANRMFTCTTIQRDGEICGSDNTKVLVITKRLCLYHCNQCRMNSIEVLNNEE